MDQKLNLRTAVGVLTIVGILSLGGVYVVKQKFFVPSDVQSIPKVTDNSQKQEVKPTTNENNLATNDLKTKDLPSDLHNVIFEMAKNDYGSNSCEGKEITIDDYYYDFRIMDLNDDGLKEFIVMPNGFCEVHFISMRGAQNNGPIHIFEKINSKWVDISYHINGNNLEALGKKTDGYADILTYAHMSAVSSILTYYKWQKSEMKYKIVSSEEIYMGEDSDKEINNFIEDPVYYQQKSKY